MRTIHAGSDGLRPSVVFGFLELWLVISAPGGPESEVAVEVSAGDLVGTLSNAVGSRLSTLPPPGSTLFVHRTGRALDPNSTIAVSDLRFGDRVTLAPPGWRPPAPSRPARTGSALLTLSIVGGPATGQRFSLGLGDHVIGRSSQSDVTLDDPTLSRSHVRLSVRDGSVSVSDAGSSNGTFLDGTAVMVPTAIGIGTVIEAGHTLLRIDAFQPGAARSSVVEGGLVRFNRPPRAMPKTPDRTFSLSAPPTPPDKRRLPMISAIGPLVVGIPMVAISAVQGNTMFLLMGVATMVASPVLAFASYYEDRRGGRKDHVASLANFERELAKTSTDMAASLADEVIDRRRRSPDAADLVDRAHQHRSNLWERRPDDADFLATSVGWADQPSEGVVVIRDGGDEAQREKAEAELARHETARNVPVIVDVAKAGVVGLCGDRAALLGSARWMVLQLATLHSPRDVVMVGAVTRDERADWLWLPWLPHLRSDVSPLQGAHLAVGESEAAGLFEQLGSIVKSRQGEGGNRLGERRKPAPAVVAIISEHLALPRTSITRVLEEGPAAGVYVLWLGTNADSLPGECTVVLECASMPPSIVMSVPGEGTQLPNVVVDSITLDDIREAARALSPVKDVTAGGARGQIPNGVPLLELLGMQTPSANDIVQRWQITPFGVDAPIGASAGGPFVLDMRLDGPHALVGGTTGAGKSELLQTFVAALAATHPPNRVTFLLIDYKGGAAFKDCVDLPHTVGMVTDLDGHLVNRALISLNAELRRREHLLRDFAAKDLLEMERRYPDDAPPALVLIVDEFASLAKELPDFVDGVVNVAQRGRSLGIHLILATQRPAGAINDNVRANTNLRIALRMNDQADSLDVINAKDSAMLPRTLPGRSFVRTGQSELTEVQVAYVGGHTAGGAATSRRPEVMALEEGQVMRPRREHSVDEEAPTDLQLLVSTIREATTLAHIAPPRPPWVAPLPAVLPLESFANGGAQSGSALLGLVDLPAEQSQEPWWFDLERDGNLLIYGTSGAGKTTLLRSIAASLALGHTADALHIYALDFATRGLTVLESLPHVGAVIPGDDVERVQRVISLVEREIATRRDRFAQAGVSLLSEYQRSGATVPMPRIVIMLDGYSGFSSVFEKVDFGAWLDRVTELASEGRSLGIHWILTADRRTAVNLTLASAVSTRVVLRMPDDDDYSSLGLDSRATKGVRLPAGRGFVGSNAEIQTSLVGTSAAGDAQVATFERLAATMPVPASGRGPARIEGMPTNIDLGDLPTADRLGMTLGIRQSDLQPFAISLLDGNIFVAGPNRSGRSQTLATLVAGLRASTPDAGFVLIAPRKSLLTALDCWTSTASRPDDCDALAEELAATIDDRADDSPPLVIVVDDATELTDTEADSSLERLARRGKEVGIYVIASAESSLARRAYGGLVSELRRDRNGVILQPDVDLDGDLLNVKIPRARQGFWVQGRGVVASAGLEYVVHVAVSD